MWKIHNSVLDRLGATHFLTLREPCLGPDPYFGNHCFWRCWMQRTRLFPFLVRSGYNHRCAMRAVGKRGFCSMHSHWVLKCYKGLTEGDSRIHERKGQTEECTWNTEGKWFYTKLLDNMKLQNPKAFYWIWQP